MTQRGYGITNQLRYLGKNYEGFFNSSILFDDESSFKTLERDETRWSYNLSHQQKVKDYVFFNLETSSTGDPFYLSDLGSFMSGLSRTFVLPQRTDLTFFDKNLYVKVDINSFKLTNPLGVNQFQRMPGIEVTSWNAWESGIHCWGLNLALALSIFFSLNLPRSKFAFNSLDTAADSDAFFPLGIS